MNSTGSKLKVFISYAREDKDRAQYLFNILKEWKLEPWFDQESLLPGQRWENEIDKAIKNSDYYIVLLSKNSTEERGYVQKELKIALEILKKLPKSKIFVIPVCLDNCIISESLIKEIQEIQQIHMVNFVQDSTKWLEKVLAAMGQIIRPSNEFDYWDNLLIAIAEKKCIPFIGERGIDIFNQEDDAAFITNQELAEEWAKKYSYPMEDIHNLSKVAQYLEINRGSEFPQTTIRNKLRQVRSPDFTNKYINCLHAVLASFKLPIYITTNYDLFMEEALKSINIIPVSECCKWNDKLIKASEIGSMPTEFGKKTRNKYKPTSTKPLIYHFHGSINYPPSLVLTEGNYFEFVINMNNRDDEKDMLPTILRKELPNSSLLFLGYDLDDLNFRSIFQGALSFLKTIGKSQNSIAVIQIPQVEDEIRKQRIVNYLKEYTQNLFDLVIYWGTLEEFVKELKRRWEEFQNSSQMIILEHERQGCQI
jgi:SIR2-like domain/TIR domain